MSYWPLSGCGRACLSRPRDSAPQIFERSASHLEPGRVGGRILRQSEAPTLPGTLASIVWQALRFFGIDLFGRLRSVLNWVSHPPSDT